MAPQAKDPALKKLVLDGREQGFLTYRELNDHLPEETRGTAQVEAVVNMLNDLGIDVFDQAPNSDALLLQAEPPVDDVAEEAEAVNPQIVEHVNPATVRPALGEPDRRYFRQGR